MTSGYSKTPLCKKLGIKKEQTLIIISPPCKYHDLVTDLPEDLEFINLGQDKSADFIHMFYTQQSDIINDIKLCKDSLKKNGMLWISWPKGGSSIPTDLNRDWIREYVLGVGLVDVKVVAIDANWSGLKFVYRIKDRI